MVLSMMMMKNKLSFFFSLKKDTQFEIRVQKPYPIYDQTGQNQTAEKPYPLGPHIPI